MKARKEAAIRVLGCSFLIAGSASAVTYRVPSDYATIQGGLDAAAVGDTVLVAPGAYSDYTIDLTVAYVARIPDGVVLTSEAGPDGTVIDLLPLEGAAVWSEGFTAVDHTSGQTVVEGFRFAGYPEHSAGVVLSDCSPVVIRDCVFESPVPADASVYRWGIKAFSTNLHVVDCSFLRCSAPAGAGVEVTGGSLTAEHCTFVECSNRAAAAGGGPAGRSLLVRDCTFRGGVSANGGAGVSAGDMTDGATVEGCVFEDMTMAQTGTITISSLGPKTVSSCVFHNIWLTNGTGGCATLWGGVVTFRSNTCSTVYQELGGSAVSVQFQASTLFENNIIANTAVAQAVSFNGGAFDSHCNVFWDNAGGSGYELSPTDRLVDPQFCDEPAGDLTLQATSPCLPYLSLGCGLIGALDQGCGTVSLTPETWAKIKSEYRTGEEE